MLSGWSQPGSSPGSLGYRQADFGIELTTDIYGTSPPDDLSLIEIYYYSYTFSIDNLGVWPDNVYMWGSPNGSGSINILSSEFGVGHKREFYGEPDIGDIIRVSISVYMDSGTSCSNSIDLVVRQSL